MTSNGGLSKLAENGGLAMFFKIGRLAKFVEVAKLAFIYQFQKNIHSVFQTIFSIHLYFSPIWKKMFSSISTNVPGHPGDHLPSASFAKQNITTTKIHNNFPNLTNNAAVHCVFARAWVDSLSWVATLCDLAHLQG